jgi:radical SAM protein with 4Fe4S-binding SPASM domain
MQWTSVRHALHLLSTLSIPKLWNAGKVLFSFYYSRVKGRPVIMGLPFAISVEPTTACNLGCPECISGLRAFTRQTGNIQSSFFKKVVDSIHETLIYLNFYFQGEPYLHKDLFDMIRYAADKGIYTSTSTNAHFLDDERARKTVESGLSRLIISIDGADQETYSQYRVGGDLSKVIAGTANLIRWKKSLRSHTPFVVFQFLVVRPNEHQVDKVRQMAASLGVDEVWIKTAQVIDYTNDPNRLIPLEQKYSRYKKDKSGQVLPVNAMPDYCWKMWHSQVITWNGLVVPCCFDKDAEHPMGNLNEQSVPEIWESKNYEEFRQELLKSRKNIDICSNCSEGIKVWQ